MKYPETLYKFREFNEFTLMSLVNHSAWFSNPPMLNDPFDCQLTFDNEIPTIKEFEDAVEKARIILSIQKKQNVVLKLVPECFDGDDFSEGYKEQISRFGERVKSQASNIGILSLTSDNLNTTMWSHYANSHSGICIGYKTSEIKKKYKLEKYLYPVKYLEADDISFNPYMKYAECCCANHPDSYKNILYEMLTTKSDDWGYENEWRIINGKPGNYDMGSKVIESICFGLKTSIDAKITVSNILKYQDVKFYQMLRSKKGLTLTPTLMNHESKYWFETPE